MQIINDNVALLSNCEVSRLIDEECAYLALQDENVGNVDKHLRLFQSKLKRYLKPFDDIPDEKVNEFLQRVQPLGLTPAELLTILNIRPKSFCHIFAIVEDTDERLSGDQVDTLLELCKECLLKECEGVESDEGSVEAPVELLTKNENNHVIQPVTMKDAAEDEVEEYTFDNPLNDADAIPVDE
uniref:DNA-directed RNA polymerase III subunit RPC9 n=1 Tax=Eutreptiella gymnastica TaxID=73025 RepID=A0A7S1NJE2_9EUGL|mmetsp:Transcript_43504/g.78176  ORF Transcript_43504/g.78176 Transcript_43504/m.78176 type:complete len:184 (+) Transcript_43504:91-642(+)